MRSLLLSLVAVSALWTAGAAAQPGGVVDGRLPSHGTDEPPPVRVIRPGRPILHPPPQDQARARAMLRDRRAVNLARFRAYVDGENYPRNHVGGGLRNVLIDDEGRFCAAANLMRQDGHGHLVRQAAITQNDLRFFHLRSGPLYEWMLTSGFTQEEIDEIQEPFVYIPPTEDRLEDRRWELEKQRLKRIYLRVISQLERDTERSLDLAAARLVAHRAQTQRPPVVITPSPPRPEPPVVVHPLPRPPVVRPPVVVHPHPAPPVVRPLPDPRRPLLSVWAPR